MLLSNNPYRRLALTVVLLMGVASCHRERHQATEDKILARIGDRTISVDEFKRRTEFTVRPIYPNQSPEALKKNCLNNLIIEKLFSLEAGEDDALTRHPSFQALVKGIKEQAMREQLYYRLAFDTAEPDSDEIKKIYPLAGRNYEVEFLMIPGSTLAKPIQATEGNLDSLQAIFSRLQRSAGGPFRHTVHFRDPEHPAIHEALFSVPLSPDTLIGPLQLEEDNFMMLKIVNWKYVPAIGREEAQTRWQQVSLKMKQNRADRWWHDYSQKIMKGKSIQFNKTSFAKVAALFFSIRPAINDKGLSPFDRPFQQTEEQLQATRALDDRAWLLDAPFFRVDDRVWTVRDFRNELSSHPLVYRTQAITAENFKQQFIFAIADLIRDHYLTQEGYRRSLDKDPQVKRTVAMWQDAYRALHFRNALMAQALAAGEIDSTDNLQKRRYLNEAVQRLQKKYRGQIHIDEKELNNITVTDVNMFVLQPHLPYPVVVPGFPQYTSKDQLDE